MIIKGTVISSGYAFGNAFILNEQDISISFNKIKKNNIDYEIKRFLNSIDKTINQFKEIKNNKNINEDKKLLFDGYILLLEDCSLKKDVLFLIKNKYFSADAAVDLVFKKQVEDLNKLSDSYLKERVYDILDVRKRLIFNIKNLKMIDFSFLDNKKKIIIFAKDLSPSQVTQFNLDKIVGFVTELGSITSHTSIIAKSLNLPAIINVKNILSFVNDNDFVVIDSINNEIYLNPSNDVLCFLKKQNKKFLNRKDKLEKIRYLSSITIDNHNIKLLANVSNKNDVDNVLKNGAEGIGLYRTEFLFMDRNSFPSEEEQFNVYKKIAEIMGNKVVTIRTADLGGDKFLSYIDFPKEDVPFLGWRAIRIFMDRKDIMHAQVRAILRASVFGNLRIMFPMIISIEEVYFIKNEIEFLKNQLKLENKLFNNKIKIGVMIETPAAAIISKFLAKELDFFSIGTNDLTQYILAVDRNNSVISHLYNTLSPSVIKFIKIIIDSVHSENKKVSICGELASDEKAIFLLLGLGIDELSMHSNFIPKIKYKICNTYYKTCKKISEKILLKKTIKEIDNILKKYIK